MDVIVAAIIAAVVGLAIGIGAGYFVRKNISEAKIGEADSLAKNIIDQANKDAETIKKEKLLEAKEEIHKFRSDAEKENRERRSDSGRKAGFCGRICQGTYPFQLSGFAEEAGVQDADCGYVPCYSGTDENGKDSDNAGTHF